MAIGSIWTGRWMATLIDPPVAADALADALGLAPADSEAAGADALGWPVLHAAITMLTADIESPMTDARLMNWRRVIRPLANDSTRSSSTGVADRRTRSSRE